MKHPSRTSVPTSVSGPYCSPVSQHVRMASGTVSVLLSALALSERSVQAPSPIQSFSPLGEAEGGGNSLHNGVIALMPQAYFFSNYHIS